MQPDYTYNAKVLRVVDGDTIDAEVDLGFHLKAVLRFRVLGIDAPELKSKDPAQRILGEASTAFARKKLAGQLVVLRTHKSDSFGRWLAQVFYRDSAGVLIDFAREMLATGMAEQYRE